MSFEGLSLGRLFTSPSSTCRFFEEIWDSAGVMDEELEVENNLVERTGRTKDGAVHAEIGDISSESSMSVEGLSSEGGS